MNMITTGMEYMEEMMDRLIESAQISFENETEDLMQLSALKLAAKIWIKQTNSREAREYYKKWAMGGLDTDKRS